MFQSLKLARMIAQRASADAEVTALEKQLLAAKVDGKTLNGTEHIHADNERRAIPQVPHIEDMEVPIYQLHVADPDPIETDDHLVEQLARHDFLCRAVYVGGQLARPSALAHGAQCIAQREIPQRM